MSKKKVTEIRLINFNAKHLSPQQIAHYIKKIKEEENFHSLGFRIIPYTMNNEKFKRCLIYTTPDNHGPVVYFNDRCPAMVENECRALLGVPFSFVTWPNGFQEVTFK